MESGAHPVRKHPFGSVVPTTLPSYTNDDGRFTSNLKKPHIARHSGGCAKLSGFSSLPHKHDMASIGLEVVVLFDGRVLVSILSKKK